MNARWKMNWIPAFAGMTTLIRVACAGTTSAAIVALVACSVAPAPPTRYYRVEMAPAPSTSSLSGRIAIEPFETYGIYNERPLLFRSGDAASALEQYHYQFWAEPPAVMLRDSLIGYLRNAFASAQVAQAGGRVRGDLVVRTRLKRFEHILGSPSQASFAVEFRVTDADDNERLLLSFDEKAPAAGSSVEDYVAAMDQVIAKAYARLAEQLRHRVTSQAGSSPQDP